ncbi:hypothetical protein LINPERPRIM_LOCUS25473 [Linum perenne]
MSSNQSHTRVDTLEIKSLLVKRIGHHRAQKYFDQLTRLFSLKTTKSEFDRFCVRVIGRENVPLHNQLIRSIVKNACLGKIPPLLKAAKRAPSRLNATPYDGSPRNGLQSLYGEAFPLSPRDRKFKDRPSPLGPLGKTHNLSSEELISRAQEQSATELLSLGSRPPVEVASVEDGEEVEQVAGSPGVQSRRTPVTAPLGISMNLGVSRKGLLNMSVYGTETHETCHKCGELPDTRLLRNRLQQKLQAEGLRASLDCVNLLNNALDAYLKRLIEPCIGLACSLSRKGFLDGASSGGGFVPGSIGMSSDRYRQQITESHYGSMLDFRVSMESNPEKMGAEWGVKLEKITLRASEEG